MNTRRELYNNTFELYLIGSIVMLYLGAEDTERKHVIIKIGSAPGQLKMKMIERLSKLGFILYSGVSNTK